MEELPIVLVVEDEVGLQDFAREALSDAGFHPMVTPSGEKALTSLKSGVVKYRALVTDISLGRGIDGWALAKLTREVDPLFPIIYMTGAAADQWASKGVPNSILLEKPFAPAQLVTAVSQLLNIGNPPA